MKGIIARRIISFAELDILVSEGALLEMRDETWRGYVRIGSWNIALTAFLDE
jgi:hypothetical protein